MPAVYVVPVPNMRILIVEDEAKTREYLRKGLAESGFIVDVAANGIDGLHLATTGEYDLVVLDPPSYQKGSFVATKDYARLVRRLPELLAPGGHALVCLNTPKLDTAFLRDLVATEAPGLAFIERVANPPAFADESEERSLKVLVYRQPAA